MTNHSFPLQTPSPWAEARQRSGLRTRSRAQLQTAALLGGLLFGASAWSQSPGGKAGIDEQFQRDKAACMAIEAVDERSSCLREAGAVRAEALKGVPKGGESAEVRLRNALQRCNPLPPDRKAICERMVRGEGSESGSVQGGGVIRELTIMEPVQPLPPGAQPLPPAAPAR